jgi:hypothetical protein
MPRKKTVSKPNPYRRYSVSMSIPETAKRASTACIRHFVKEAQRDKLWAIDVLGDDKKLQSFCDYSIEVAIDYNSSSLHVIARKHLEYIRYRAHLTHHGRPINPCDHDLWHSLNP